MDLPPAWWEGAQSSLAELCQALTLLEMEVLSVPEDFEGTFCKLFAQQNVFFTLTRIFCTVAILLPCQERGETIGFHKRKQKQEAHGKQDGRRGGSELETGLGTLRDSQSFDFTLCAVTDCYSNQMQN